MEIEVGTERERGGRAKKQRKKGQKNNYSIIRKGTLRRCRTTKGGQREARRKEHRRRPLNRAMRV